MFKHAYVRGIQTGLVNSGVAVYPDADTANKIADYISDRIDIDPVAGLSIDTTHKIAQALVAASDQVKAQPGFKAASFNKLATWNDVYVVADQNAIQLMEKAAEGSTLEGGDKGNKEMSSGEAKMDATQRPVGYAEDSRGKTEVDTKPGAVGKEEEQPNKPKESPGGENSATDQSRTASLAQLFRKAAEGSTLMGGDKGNQAMSSGEAKMDASQRPAGYAILPSQGDLGELMAHISGPAVIGKETPQPNKPAESPSGSNSLTETSAKAAAEDPYITLFKKTASEVSSYLPNELSENDKVAAVRACMGLNTEEKAHYLYGLQKEASVRVAAAAEAALPPGSRGDRYAQHTPEATHSRPGAYDGRKGNQGSKAAGELPPWLKRDEKDTDDKSDDKKDDDKHEMKSEDKKDDKEEDKKEDGDKEASLRNIFRRLEAAQRGTV